MNEYELIEYLERKGCLVLRGYTVVEIHPKTPLSESDENKLLKYGFIKGTNYNTGRTCYYKI